MASDKSSTGEEPVTDVARLPTPPGTASRIDSVPADFAALVSRRPLMLGDVIAGRYKLLSSLDGGAMGDVFVAQNVVIGRRVAVKVLRPELLADASFRQRLQHEADAIAAIDHRNVVRLLDLIVGDPTFLVMELVPGPTLAEVLKREGRLQPVRAINIAIRLGWALDAVHRAGVIHRDIKPSNVILSPDPEFVEEPKLIDFGLAKLIERRPEEQVTRQGQIVGTPFYIAPEQVGNRAVDARADIYALGCLLFHLLTGRPPFEGPDDFQLFYQHVHQPPPRLRELLPSASAELEAVLARSLAKDPAARYASIGDMVQALGKVDRRAGQARPKPTPHAPKFVWYAAALLGVTAVGGGGFVAGRAGRSAPDTMALVTTRPPGARLDIDGKRWPQTTPLAAPLLPGRHTFVAKLAGHDDVEQIATVEPGQRIALELALPAASRQLRIQTTPSGAEVFVDGHLVAGLTPLTATITSDDFHSVRVEKNGYVSGQQALAPEDHADSITIALDAERSPRGTLWIDANRAASVFLDGGDSGLMTPTLGVRVTPGEHLVELRDGSGQRGPVAHVKVAQGETVHLTLDFPTEHR